MPARFATSCGSTSSISWISCSISAKRRFARRIPPRRARDSSRALAIASSAARALRSASASVVLGVGEAVGGGAALRLRVFDFVQQCASPLRERGVAPPASSAHSILVSARRASIAARAARRLPAWRSPPSRHHRQWRLRRRAASSPSRVSAWNCARSLSKARALRIQVDARPPPVRPRCWQFDASVASSACCAARVPCWPHRDCRRAAPGPPAALKGVPHSGSSCAQSRCSGPASRRLPACMCARPCAQQLRCPQSTPSSRLQPEAAASCLATASARASRATRI